MIIKYILKFSIWILIGQLQIMGCTRPMDSLDNELSNFSDKIVFFSDRDRVLPFNVYNELFVMDFDGKNQMRLIEGSADYPSYSPSGSEIICSIAEYGGDLFKINLNDRSVVRLTFNYYGQYPIYSPDGSRIAFFHQHSLILMDSDGANIQALSGILRPSQTYFDFSPDGSKIVIDSDGNIILIDITEDTLTNITNDPANDRMPVFSQDGTEIFFISNREGTDQIFQMNSDGSNKNRLTNVNYKIFGTLRFSPNGDKLLYSISRAGFSPEICTMNTDGSNQLILREGLNPRYTADGKNIVFESYNAPDEGWLDIYIMNSNGGNQKNLTNNPASDSHPIIPYQ